MRRRTPRTWRARGQSAALIVRRIGTTTASPEYWLTAWSDVTEFWDRVCIPVGVLFALSWSRRLAASAQDELKRVAVGWVVPQPFKNRGQVAGPLSISALVAASSSMLAHRQYELLLFNRISACTAPVPGGFARAAGNEIEIRASGGWLATLKCQPHERRVQRTASALRLQDAAALRHLRQQADQSRQELLAPPAGYCALPFSTSLMRAISRPCRG